jgi:putative endonuclease
MAWMYILECSDGSYYVGSTKDIKRRIIEHQEGLGANYTSKRLPVQLVYCEEYDRIDEAFYREKQVQGWRRAKREALINGQSEKLPALARKVFERAKIKDVNGGFDTPEEHGLLNHQFFSKDDITGESGG